MTEQAAGYPSSRAVEQAANTSEVEAIKSLVKRSEITFEEEALNRKRTAKRFTPDRYLDENEREWNALDAICRSRPWAKNKDTPFAYPFREASHSMMKVEGSWHGWKGERRLTRGNATSEVLTSLILGQEFPPELRVLLFTPEFGNEFSYEKENWTYLEPENNTDVWIISWQGWTNFEDMIEQVAAKVLSFADSVSTIWLGQGMGALVAYELMKYLQKTDDQSPNLPVSLIACDCPAPHLFSQAYKPYNMSDWSEKLSHVQISTGQKKAIADDVSLMKQYKFTHEDDKRLPVPISALCHAGNPYAKEADVQSWEAYSKEEAFEFVDPLDEEEEENYTRGKGYGLNVDPAVIATVAQHNEQYNRWIKDDVLPDIGPTDGPMPDEIDCVCIGAGTCGLITANELAKSGKKVVIIDRADSIGGVWYLHANTYSRVNTSEIGYRFHDITEPWSRANEDHTPAKSMLKDMHSMVAQSAYGCVRLQTTVMKVDSPEKQGGNFLVKVSRNGVEHTIKSKSVHISVNRRLGKPRIVEYPGKEHFRGKEVYGFGNEIKGINLWGKTVVVVGAGAFAFENARTVLEHGCKHVLMLCRREGTTCPKWIDMLAFLRPMDDTFSTNKAANMISFDAWRECYTKAGLKTPACWDEGMLKPHNHTVSVSDLAYIGAYHGLFDIKVGEIAKFTDDGKGVEFKDGGTHECDLIIKCTGFHITDDAAQLTGIKKMQPYGLMGFNIDNQAEPLLDGGQFGSTKGRLQAEIEYGFTEDELVQGMRVYKEMGLDEKAVKISGNPFGSGATGPARVSGKFFNWCIDHPEYQSSLLKHSGDGQMNVEELWQSQIGEYSFATLGRLISGLSKQT